MKDRNESKAVSECIEKASFPPEESDREISCPVAVINNRPHDSSAAGRKSLLVRRHTRIANEGLPVVAYKYLPEKRRSARRHPRHRARMCTSQDSAARRA